MVIIRLVVLISVICCITFVSASYVEHETRKTLFRHKRMMRAGFDLLSCPAEETKVEGPAEASIIIHFANNPYEERIRDLLGKGVHDLVDRGFNLNQPTMLYVHAFGQNPRTQWLKDVRRRYDEMFKDKSASFNLIFYDWSFYAKRDHKLSSSNYKEATGFVPFAGTHLGKFLDKFAETHNYDMNQMHIVTYSLSTHLSGIAGRQLRADRKVGRLTTLDETGVCFHANTDFSRKWSLRHDDARLVVNKRYDLSGVLGGRRVNGGINIFVNGGQEQPGVPWSKLGASHYRASKHEVQPTFNDQCHEVAYACNSHAAFLAGECADCGQNGEKCYYMDSLEEMRLRPALGPLPEYQQNMSLFIETGPGPYCLHHYQVVVQMNRDALPSSLDLLKSGSVTFEFNREFEVAIKDYAGNNRFSTLALFEEPLGDIDEVKARVSYTKFWWSNEEFMKNVHHIDINYMSHPIAEERAKRSFQFCHHGCNLELPITACSKTC